MRLHLVLARYKISSRADVPLSDAERAKVVGYAKASRDHSGLCSPGIFPRSRPDPLTTRQGASPPLQGCYLGALDRLIRLANWRYAPGTPAGSCRNHA
jgi:hypothetical protein